LTVAAAAFVEWLLAGEPDAPIGQR
jgi:hypothetical protein